MGVYKAAVEAAEVAEEQLGAFKRMIAKKEAQLAAKAKTAPSQKIRLRVKVKSKS